ncbi:MAG TPA: sigma 54-interacting transcriptional regulator [Polyangiaceae bacterium]
MPFDDTTTRAPLDAAPPGKTFVLRTGTGPELRLDETQPPTVLVGKSPACELRLDDPLVSRRHASIEIGPQSLRIRDLGSTNGTLVNGVRIVEAILRGGETIVVGTITLRVDVEATAGAHPAPSGADRFGRLLGASPEMRRLHHVFRRLASSDVPIVIEGETGTGKELLAESIHEESGRARGPFVVLDCTTVSASLLESELFGHERGAFTGAIAARKGVFEQADGGTLFIDEIGDLDVALQSKLLRAIERSEVRRVGGTGWAHVDVRVIAATRRDLDRAVQDGRFRDDLFFRLAVGRVEIPPLRRRHGDVVFLAQRFWTAFGGQPPEVPPEVVARLEAYEWPGNVRELYNAIARQIAVGEMGLGAATAGRAAMHPAALAAGDFLEDTLAQDLPFPRARDRVLDEFERRYVERVLAKHGGNVARAAAASGIARRYFQIIRARSR